VNAGFIMNANDARMYVDGILIVEHDPDELVMSIILVDITHNDVFTVKMIERRL
jgi:hypothetical protein